MKATCFSQIKIGFDKSLFCQYLKDGSPLQEFVKVFQRSGVPRDDYCKVCLYKHNQKKCRYSDIFCLDQTRVLLKDDDFIHANWVDGFTKEKEYICTQGPLRNTVEDFYEMVLRYKVPIIVMTTRSKEGSSEKCYQYWPSLEQEILKFNKYKITNTRCISSGNGIHIKDLLVSTSSIPSFNVTHIQFVNWPDHGVPDNPEEFNHLFKVVKDYKEILTESNSPIIIHCSAGIGRTGTFVVIDIARQMYEKYQYVNIKEIVAQLRQQRAQCVQTADQYGFCFLAMESFININADISFKSK